MRDSGARRVMRAVAILSSMECGCEVVAERREDELVLRHEEGCEWLAALDQ